MIQNIIFFNDTLGWSSFCLPCLVLGKWDFLCKGLPTLKNCLILVKKFNFLGYIKLYVVIFIKVYHLFENWYFDSKYHFVLWYFGQKCHFPSKIYITCGINSLDKLSNFFEKCQFLIALFYFGKKCQFMQKSVRFWGYEWIFKCSDKIMLQTFGVKWQVFLSLSIFLQKCQ